MAFCTILTHIKSSSHLFFRQQIENMSEEQLTRFEFFVRSHLSRARVKDIMTRALDSKYIITDEMGIVAGGLAKLFIGEIIEICKYNTFNLIISLAYICYFISKRC